MPSTFLAQLKHKTPDAPGYHNAVLGKYWSIFATNNKWNNQPGVIHILYLRLVMIKTRNNQPGVYVFTPN
jgi:hypothetical protein